MTIRSTVKKIDRFGVQGSVSFDPRHPNANVDLYRSLEKFLMSDQGLGGAGGPVANRVKDQRSYQASHVFNTPNERDDVTERLQKQLDEFLESKFGETAKASGKSVNELLSSQGIQPIQYRPDDFILASQNPLRSSTEKKIKAFMSMAGNTQSISGGTGEHRRHTGYYRPNDLKHVRSMLTTDARKLDEGTGNLGEMEGLYLSASQKMEARTNQNIFKNGLTEDLLNNERHPVVAKIRSDMLKQHAMKQLKGKVQSGLQEEGLLPSDEDDEKKKKGKKDKSVGAKAMEAAAAVTSKILNVAGDLKSLFSSAVGYLKSIASEIGGLKEDSAGLGITMQQALTEKYLAKLNPAYATDENVFINAAKEVYNVTDTPAKLDGIKFDDAVLHGQGKIIEPIVKAAVDFNSNPIETRNKIYNTFAKAYFNPKLSENQRIELRKHQMAALKLFGGSMATGYQVMTDVAKNYNLVNDKNRDNVMGAFYDHTNNNRTRTMVYKGFGMTAEAGLGSEENIKALNDFNQTMILFAEALKSFTMIHIDDVVRAMVALAKALLEFVVALPGRQPTAEKLLKDLNKITYIEGEKQRQVLGENTDIARKALVGKLAEAGYTGPAARGIINEILDVKEGGSEELLKIFTSRPDIEKYHGEEYKKKYPGQSLTRDLFILADAYSYVQYYKFKHDLTPKSKRGLVDTGDLFNEFNDNYYRDKTLEDNNYRGITGADYRRLIKGVKLKKGDKGEADKDLNEVSNGEYDKVRAEADQSFLMPNFNHLMRYDLPSRSLDPGGSFFNKNMQGTQNVSVENILKLQINGKEIVLRQDLDSDKKNIYYASVNV
jgi:hypothetical protein